ARFLHCSFRIQPLRRIRRMLGGLPFIATVGVEADIAAWRSRTAESNFAPGGWMRVVNLRDRPQHDMTKQGLARQSLPYRRPRLVLVQRLQQQILLDTVEAMKRPAVTMLCLGLDRVHAATPAFLLGRQRRIPCAGALALEKPCIDPGGDGHRFDALGLWYHPIAYREQRLPLLFVEKSALWDFGEAFMDDRARGFVPGLGLPFVKN